MLTLLARLFYITEEIVYGPYWIRDVERCLKFSKLSTKKQQQQQQQQHELWDAVSLLRSSVFNLS